MPSKTDIDFNTEFSLAYDCLQNSNKHVFITGRAGTGKSTLLQYFRNSTKKNVVVLAPTGVAAVNVQGQTLHSFFNFKPDITLESIKRIKMRKEQYKLYRKLDAIIIDEVSMLRADVMDFVDEFLRMHGPKAGKPFGGVQMVFIGDLYQLPPVVTRNDRDVFSKQYPSPYFFDANVFKEVDFEYIELQTIYRQHDEEFIDVLNAVRENKTTGVHLQKLQDRYDPQFIPDEDEVCIYLSSTNDLANRLNHDQLKFIDEESVFCCGEIDGTFDERSLPTHIDLELKVGAQVMMLNNDSMGRWINGSVGRIIKIIRGDDEPVIRVDLVDGEIVDVIPHTWEQYEYRLDEETEVVTAESIGMFRQYPLKLAWAVTVHKAQGKTFPKVVIDRGRGMFSHGQMYVALSRCPTLEGIILKRPMYKSDIITDQRVIQFLKKFETTIPTLK